MVVALWVGLALATQPCFEHDTERHALGVVLHGASEDAIHTGRDWLAQASQVMIRQFNIQLDLIGQNSDVVRPACLQTSGEINTALLLPPKFRDTFSLYDLEHETYGGIHVHIVEGCPEPSDTGGFVLAGDVICAGHVVVYRDRGDYLTLLHEIGHLLTATHPGQVATPTCSVGGIMDYCKGNPHPRGVYEGMVQFTQESYANICAHLRAESKCLYQPGIIQHRTTYDRTVAVAVTGILIAGVMFVTVAYLLDAYDF